MGKSFKGFSKALSLILALAMVVTCVPTSAYAAELLSVDESEDLLIGGDSLVEESSDALVTDDASASEEKSSSLIDTQKEADLAAAPEENTAGEEEIGPDTTAYDMLLYFDYYNTSTAKASSGNTMDPQSLVIEDFYAANYAALYAGNGDGTAKVNKTVHWDHDDDYKFYISASAGYELPTTGDKALSKTIGITYVENAGKATITDPDEILAATVKAVEGSDFTVSAPDVNDRVLVTINKSFLKKAFDGRSTTDVTAHDPGTVSVAVTTIATGKKFVFDQPTVKGDGGLDTLGAGLRTATYGTDYKLDVKGNRDAASKQADAKIKSVDLTVKDAEGKDKKFAVKKVSGAAASTKPFSDGDWSGITEETAISSDDVFAVKSTVINKLISGEYTNPVITVEFGEEESTDIAVKYADSNISEIANFHVGLAAGASATKVTKDTAVTVAFKGKDGRAVKEIGYKLDDGAFTYVDPVGPGTNANVETTNTWANAYTIAGSSLAASDLPTDWYGITIPAGKMVGSELTLAVSTAEPASFAFTATSGGGTKADVSVEVGGSLVVIGAVTTPSPVDVAATAATAPWTYEEYSFKVTPVTNKTVTKVTYKLGSAAAQTLTAAEDGVTYTIPENVINSALRVEITAENSTSAGKYNVIKDSATASTVKDMSGTCTIVTTAGGTGDGTNLATSGEYFYFKATPSATAKKITKFEYKDAGATDPDKKNEALEIARDANGVVTYRTITKSAGILTLYGTEADKVSVTAPVNDMVEFVGETTPEKAKEYKFTVKPVQGAKGVTKITKVSYKIGSGSPVVVFNNAAGSDSAAGVSATINATSVTDDIYVYADTKVVVDKSNYTATFEEAYSDPLLDTDRPGLTKDAAGNYSLKLANGETKNIGTSAGTGELSVKIKNTAGQTITGTTTWTATKTGADDKVVDVVSGTSITGNRKSTITSKTDVISVVCQESNTTGDAYSHNYPEYTATLGVEVTDRFSSVKLYSVNNVLETTDGFLVKASGETESFVLFGVNGRTGDDEAVTTGDMYAIKDPDKTYVAWTVSPDYNNKTAQAYSWALTDGTTTDNDAINITISRTTPAEADTPSARVAATLNDKWGITYPVAVSTMTLIADPYDYVVLPTVTRANSVSHRGFNQGTDVRDWFTLESDSEIKSVTTNLSVFQQAKATVDSADKIVAGPENSATSAKNVEKTVGAGNYNVVPASDVTVSWDVYDYVYDHTGDGATTKTYDLYYKATNTWTKLAKNNPDTNTVVYYKKVKIDTEKETDKYATISGSGLNWTVTAVPGATHSATASAGNVIATGFEPTFKVGDITLSSPGYGATSLGQTDCSLIVTVGGRIAKEATRLYINDHTVVDKSGATDHTKAQAFKKTYLDTLGVYSIVTSEATNASGHTVDGYNVGIALPETAAGTKFVLPGMDEIDPANVGAGRIIYGWTNGTNYFDCGEEVVAGDKYYAIWGQKYVVNTLYNGNLVTKDSEGKDDYTNVDPKDSTSNTNNPTYTLIYDTTNAVIPVGLEVNEVVGIYSTADGSNVGKPQYAKDAIHTTTGVALTETTTGGNVLNTTKLAAGELQFASKDTAKVTASYKVSDVEYPWAVKYTAAVPSATSVGTEELEEYWMGITTTATTLTVVPDDTAKQYYVTLSDLDTMKAGTEGQEVTATYYEKQTTPPDTAVAGFGTVGTVPGRYEWKSSNEGVIKVTQGAAGSLNKATLKPVAQGTSKVTFTFVDASGRSYSKDADVTVGAPAGFIKFADSKGKVVADPEFLTDKKGGSGKDYYVMAVTSESATDASSAIATATFSNSAIAVGSPLASVAFAGTTIPGLYKMTVTGAAVFNKTTLDVKATVGSDVIAKEMTFKTYGELTIDNKVYESATPYVASNDGAPSPGPYDLKADILLDGEVQYADAAKTTKLTSITIPYYSTDLVKTATATDGNYDWTWTIDTHRYSKQFAGMDFVGFYTSTSAQGKNVGFAKASKNALVWETKDAASDSAAIAGGSDVTVYAGFEAGKVTNVSGIPSTLVKLSDSKTTGTDATTIANFELGITPYDTVQTVYAIADDTGMLVFETTADTKITAAEAYLPIGSLAVTTTADQTWIPAGTPSNKIRTDILGIGMIKGAAGKTKVHITNGEAGDKKVEYGSFEVAISGAKYDASNNIIGYYDENGELLKNTSKVIGDKTYYFGDDGKVVTNGVVDIDGKLVLIAGGVKETAVGLHDLAGKTYCIKADGTVAKNELSTVDGKDYVFREDGTMVKYTDPDVDADHKATVNGVVYVIASDNTAKQDDKKIVTKVGAFVWTPAKNKDYKKDTTVTATLDVEYKMEKAQTTGSETLNATVVLDPSSTATKKVYTATVTASGYYKDATTVYDWTEVKDTKTYTVDESGDGKKDDQGGSTETEPSQPDDKANWNLFYTGFEMNLDLPSGADPSKADPKAKWTQFYSVDATGTVTVKATGADNLKKAANATNSLIVIPVFDSDNKEIGDFEYSLPVFYAEPKLKLSSAKATYATKGEKEQTFTTTVLEEKSNKIFEPCELDQVPLWTASGKTNIKEIDLGTDTGAVTITTENAAKGKIKVQNENWAKAIEVSYNIAEGKNDVIEPSATVVNFNANTDKNEAKEISITLNGSDTFAEDAITAELPKKWDSNIELDGIEGGKVTSSTIKISVKDAAKPVAGNYTIKLSTANKGKANIKVAVAKNTLDKAVKLNVKAKMDLTTGQPMVIVPDLRAVNGEITAVEFDEASAALFDAEVNGLGQIVVTAKETDKVNAKTTYTTTLTVTVSGVECPTALKFKPNATKPKVKIDKITLPASAFAANVEGTANVLATYKYNKKTFTIAPTKVEFDKATKNESDETISSKGLYKLTYDETTGTIKVENNSTTAKAETVKVVLTFPGNIQVKANLNIKVNKKK